jgi:hypothetical protein
MQTGFSARIPATSKDLREIFANASQDFVKKNAIESLQAEPLKDGLSIFADALAKVGVAFAPTPACLRRQKRKN